VNTLVSIVCGGAIGWFLATKAPWVLEGFAWALWIGIAWVVLVCVFERAAKGPGRPPERRS
jgi:hypothetical protein